MDTLQESKCDPFVSGVLTSYRKWNLYNVNFVIAAYSAKDYCARNMKLSIYIVHANENIVLIWADAPNATIFHYKLNSSQRFTNDFPLTLSIWWRFLKTNWLNISWWYCQLTYFKQITLTARSVTTWFKAIKEP